MLWSGHRPRLLKRLLLRGKLQPDLKTIVALGWAGLAALSPTALRLALKGVAWSRNSASRSDAGKDVVEWRLPRPVPAKNLSRRTQAQQEAPGFLNSGSGRNRALLLPQPGLEHQYRPRAPEVDDRLPLR